MAGVNVSELANVVYTRLKFESNEKCGMAGYVSQNHTTKQWRGVTSSDRYRRVICVASKELKPLLSTNVLYETAMVPMRSGKGFVAVDAYPYEFKATVELTYVPKVVYELHVRFGNRDIIYSPVDGRHETVRKFSSFRRLLEKRVDIRDKDRVLERVDAEASRLVAMCEKEGHYVPDRP